MALFKEEEVVQGKNHEVIPGTPAPIPKSDKVLIIDADTIVYSVASVYEYIESLLPEWNYEDPETYKRLIDDPNYDEAEHGIWTIDLEKAFDAVRGKVDTLLWLTGTNRFELHFTSGKNFRYTVDPMYKSNRKETRYPVGLRELKKMAVEEFGDRATIHSEIEADDYVVWKKKQFGDDAILAAVDKDVLRGCAGKHFNYYSSVKYKIPMKWVEYTEEEAFRFPYQQCLEGDTADGIDGIKGIGPKKAIKILSGCDTEEDLWLAVLEQYDIAGKSREEALVTMRLVSMNQLDEKGELKLWESPFEGEDNE